jgi:hypothetical protein
MRVLPIAINSYEIEAPQLQFDFGRQSLGTRLRFLVTRFLCFLLAGEATMFW